MVFEERDPRALRVLARALGSTSRVTRLRAVSMLANIDCRDRTEWLEAACSDADEGVAQTALGVLSWVAQPTDPPWPQREDPRFDRVAAPLDEAAPCVSTAAPSRWQWEYVVEVWRDDGLLLGSYVAATCDDDDEHAKRIALGQAILANSGGTGDAFDAATAAAFIVAKRRLPGRRRAQGQRGTGPGSA
jgi:hypothetical protein